MDTPELQDPKNVSAITVKNLNSTVRKTSNTKSLNNSYVTKVWSDVVGLDEFETSPEAEVLPEYRYLYQPEEQHGNQKKTRY